MKKKLINFNDVGTWRYFFLSFLLHFVWLWDQDQLRVYSTVARFLKCIYLLQWYKSTWCTWTKMHTRETFSLNSNFFSLCRISSSMKIIIKIHELNITYKTFLRIKRKFFNSFINIFFIHQQTHYFLCIITEYLVLWGVTKEIWMSY